MPVNDTSSNLGDGNKNNISRSVEIAAQDRHIRQPNYQVDFQWHREDQPVLYVIGKGRVNTAKDALAVIEIGVQMIEASQFSNVCVVYNMLGIEHMPALARFINAGSFPNSLKTAHIIIGTHNPALQLAASLSAVMGSKRMRTMQACSSELEIQHAVSRWLAQLNNSQRLTLESRY